MPAGGPTAASSLYSGIFSKEKDASATSAAQDSTDEIAKIESGKESEQPSTSREDSDATSNKPQAWSAALRFAPRKTTAQASKMRKLPAASIMSSTFASTPISTEAEPEDQSLNAISEESSSSKKRIVTSEAQPSSSNGWSKLDSDLSGSNIQQVKLDALRVSKTDNDTLYPLPIITAPPELTISAEEMEKDRALFAELAEQRGEGKNTNQDNYDWHDDQEEDEDVNGFANTDAGRRAKRKRNKRKRNASPTQGASLRMDADYDVKIPNDYSQFKNLLRIRRETIQRMEQARKAQREREEHHGDPGNEDLEESEDDDDTYRRERMNRFAPPLMYKSDATDWTVKKGTALEDDDEKPYLSPPPPDSSTAIISNRVATIAEETGEEAYLRRVAMSQIQETQADAPIASDHVSTQPIVPDFAARTAAAAAIAAKLAMAAPSQQQETLVRPIVPSFVPSSSSSSQSSSFAQRLMEKQGWKEGEALGAQGHKGLIDPILAKKVEVARNKQRNTNERYSQPNRGTMINTHDEAKRREEREKFGTPSQVILLEDMVDLKDVDDELGDEIGEECAKHGYVERVFIWPQGPNGVRIFVKFSGMAGAWRCVKELEGRFFGGKTVRARYYPLMDFEGGNYMNTLYS